MEWTEINVRPSADLMSALVLDGSGQMFVADWDESDGEFRLNNDYFESDSVTHWMPLPDLPSGFLGR